MKSVDRASLCARLVTEITGKVDAADRLAPRLGISVRTLYRYVGRLRAQGINIEGEAGVGMTIRVKPQREEKPPVACKTILKTWVKLTERQTIQVPADAFFVSAGFDGAQEMSIWWAIDPAKPPRDLEIVIVRTGKPLPHVGSFIATLVQDTQVWHIFTGPNHGIDRAKEMHFQTKDNG